MRVRRLEAIECKIEALQAHEDQLCSVGTLPAHDGQLMPKAVAQF